MIPWTELMRKWITKRTLFSFFAQPVHQILPLFSLLKKAAKRTHPDILQISIPCCKGYLCKNQASLNKIPCFVPVHPLKDGDSFCFHRGRWWNNRTKLYWCRRTSRKKTKQSDMDLICMLSKASFTIASPLFNFLHLNPPSRFMLS